jgi:hypothetical protein
MFSTSGKAAVKILILFMIKMPLLSILDFYISL